MITAAAARSLRIGILREILEKNVGPVPQHRVNDLQRWLARWQQRLDSATEKPLETGSPRAALVVSLQDGMSWQQIASDREAWAYCMFDGAAPVLTVVRRGRDLTEFGKRLSLALAIFIAALLVWKLFRYEKVRDAFSRWPQLPGVVIGLAWWLWLSPSALGWLIAAVFLASSLRPAWRSRPMRPMR